MNPVGRGVLALCGLLAAWPSSAATLLVSPSGTDSGTCTTTPCATIAYALGQASPGDTLDLAAGTFVENVVIDKAVTIGGAGQAATTIYPAVSQPTCTSGSGSLCGALGNASNVLVVAAAGVTIHDLTVDGDNPALNGIVVGGANVDARNGIIENYLPGTPFDGTTVHHVTVRNIYLRGLYAASGGSGFSFHDDVVDNVQGDLASIGIFGSGASGVVQHCTVSRANDAISANWSRGIQFLGNTVTGSGSGIHTDNNGGSGGAADLISGNTVSNGTPGAYGIWVFAPYVAPTVENNTVTNVDVGLAVAGSNAAVTPLFTGNVVTGSNVANGAGFYATTSEFGWGSNDVRATLTDNTFTNTTDGLYLQAEATHTATVTAIGNTITGASGNGIFFFAAPSGGVGTYATTLHFNRIAGNGTGLSNGLGGNTVSAERNWWGCNGGPGATTALGTCNAVTGAGTTTTDPVLVLAASATPTCLTAGNPSTLTADLAHDATLAAAPPGAPDGTPISFSSTLAGSAMVPASGTLSAGVASSTLSSPGAGATSLCATVDFERQCAGVSLVPATPSASNDGPACAGGTLTLSTPAIVGATYDWTGPGGFHSTERAPSIANVTAAAAGTYSVVVDVNGCVSTAGSTVASVKPTPSAPSAFSNAPISAGATLFLTTPAVAGATYHWIGPNGFSSSLQNPSITGATTAAAGTYSVTVTVDGCTSAAGTTDVTVTSGMTFYTLAPCRVLDTRGAAGTYGGPAFAAGEVREYPLIGACGVPSSARAVSANVTVTQPAAAGQFTAYPADGTLPPTSTINFPPGITRANNAMLWLSSDGTGALAFANESAGTAHLVLDVNGYFR